MKKLTIRETREALPHLDRLLESEGELTITRRGKAVARVVSVGGRRTIPSHKTLRGSMAPLRTGSEQLVREDRDGR